ncbi:MAG: hypothetical protein RBU37_21135 [Myxococcota bacterium]|nr:hypothetical protein [Myxococcota bacterium]
MLFLLCTQQLACERAPQAPLETPAPALRAETLACLQATLCAAAMASLAHGSKRRPPSARNPALSAAFPVSKRCLLRCGQREGVLSYHRNKESQQAFMEIEEEGRRWSTGMYTSYDLSCADIDADGCSDVVLGVWSTKRRHNEPEPHRTVWVLSWRHPGLTERWRGSALSRPLHAFALANVDDEPADELLSLERSASACTLNAYSWNGFGFRLRARRPASCDGVLLAGGQWRDAEQTCALRLERLQTQPIDNEQTQRQQSKTRWEQLRCLAAQAGEAKREHGR